MIRVRQGSAVHLALASCDECWSGRRESNPRMQLGKLDVSQSQSELSCKTSDLPLQSAQWVTGHKQNSWTRLRAVNKVVTHLNERWRVMEYAAGTQWILEQRAGERHGTARSDDRSYCRTREAPIRCCRASAGEIEPAASIKVYLDPQRVFPAPSNLIVERDDGRFQIGLRRNVARPFETRGFAESVAMEVRNVRAS
jgi:hypothetical protein